MAKIEKSIDVDVPISVAYNQWTQFEDFPKFMEGVEEVTQLDDARQHWVANINGQRKEWYAKITEQVPDQRIAWTSEGGTFTSGVVTFQRSDENKTQVMLQMEYAPRAPLRRSRQAGLCEPAGRRRPQAIQGVRRVPRERDGRLARNGCQDHPVDDEALRRVDNALVGKIQNDYKTARQANTG